MDNEQDDNPSSAPPLLLILAALLILAIILFIAVKAHGIRMKRRMRRTYYRSSNYISTKRYNLK